MVAADEPTERTIIECLIRELNTKFNVGLDNNFSTSRSAEPHGPDNIKETVDFVLVGSSTPLGSVPPSLQRGRKFSAWPAPAGG